MELPSESEHASIEKISLMESALLMCLRKDGDMSSGPVSSKSPALGVVAGILMELTLSGYIQQEGTDKFKLIKQDKTGDDILDDAIEIMKETKEATNINDWLKSLNGTLIFRSGIKNLRDRVMVRLVDKKILDRDESKTLGISSVKYPFSKTDGVEQFDAALRKSAFDLQENKTVADRPLCVLGIFEAMDRPFRSKLGNALDINRIFPDKTEREKIRNVLDQLFAQGAESVSTEQATTKSVANAVTTSLIRRMISIAVLGMFHVLTNL